MTLQAQGLLQTSIYSRQIRGRHCPQLVPHQCRSHSRQLQPDNRGLLQAGLCPISQEIIVGVGVILGGNSWAHCCVTGLSSRGRHDRCAR